MFSCARCFCHASSRLNISKKSPGFWTKEENINNFLLELQQKLNLNTPKDWNCLSQSQIINHGGKRLLQLYSTYEIKCKGCPEGKKIFIKPKKKKSFKYWDNEENISIFLSNLEKKLNLKTQYDWNSISTNTIKSHDGGSLLNKLSLFTIRRKGFWDKKENIDRFLNELKEKYNLYSLEDWKKLSKGQITSLGGSDLCKIFSLSEIKCLGFPDGKEYFSQSSKPIGFWNNEENVKKFLSNLEKTLKLTCFEDWDLITKKQIQENGGNGLFNKYSLYDIKCIGFPEGKKLFKNHKSPGFWENEENIQTFLNSAQEKLNLRTSEDWNRISTSQIKELGGGTLLSKYSKQEILKEKIKIFKNFDGEESFLHSTSKFNRSSQRWLFIQLQKIFPREEIIEDYYHSEISRTSGFATQFDIFIVKKDIAIEYHGRQHYEDIPSGFGPLEMYKFRDLEKVKLCKEFGVHLIIIPYWWDNSLLSLKKMLKESDIDVGN